MPKPLPNPYKYRAPGGKRKGQKWRSEFLKRGRQFWAEVKARRPRQDRRAKETT